MRGRDGHPALPPGMTPIAIAATAPVVRAHRSWKIAIDVPVETGGVSIGFLQRTLARNRLL